MATLTGLAILTAILVTNLSYISAKEFTSSDHANNSNFSPIRGDVRYGNPEKEFVRENATGESSLQLRVESKISKPRRKHDRKKIVGLITHEERAQVLMAHNRIRGNVSDPPAADMIFMVYNSQLEKAALRWVRDCDETIEVVSTRRIEFSEGELGHNFGTTKGNYSWDLMIKTWESGKSSYRYTTSQCAAELDCRHYITMIWAETNYVGCSAFFCSIYLKEDTSDENVYNYACYYAPSGNAEWADPQGTHLWPYKRGPPGTQCPPTHPYVWNNFCRSDPPCKDVKECEYPPNITTCLCEPSLYLSGQKPVLLWKLLVIVLYSFVNAYD